MLILNFADLLQQMTFMTVSSRIKVLNFVVWDTMQKLSINICFMVN